MFRYRDMDVKNYWCLQHLDGPKLYNENRIAFS